MTLHAEPASARWKPGPTARCSCSPRSASSSRRRTSSRRRPTTGVFKLAPLIVAASAPFLLVRRRSPSGPTPVVAEPRHRHLLRARRVVDLGASACSIAGWASANKYSLHRRPARRRPADRLRAAAWCSPSSASSSRPARLNLQDIVAAQSSGDDLRLGRHRQPVHPHPDRRLRDLPDRRPGRADPDPVRHARSRSPSSSPAT